MANFYISVIAAGHGQSFMAVSPEPPCCWFNVRTSVIRIATIILNCSTIPREPAATRTLPIP
jgi:hypothetical protein